MSAQSEQEEFEFRKRLEDEQAASMNSKPAETSNPYQEHVGPVTGSALGFATGVGEGLNPLAIPHNTEALGRAIFQNQNTDPNDPWYKRMGQALQNASNSSVLPQMRIEQMAPYLRAGVRSAGNMATLEAPDFQNKLAEEQQSQQNFNQSLPQWSRTLGEATPALVSLGALGAKGLNALGAGSAAEEAANTSRVAALGGGKAAVKKLLSGDKVQEMGSQLKEDQIMGPLTSRPEIQQNIATARQNYGQQIGNIVKGADATNAGEGLVPVEDIVKQAKDDVWKPLTLRSTTRDAADKVGEEINAFAEQHKGEKLTLEQLQNFKKDLEDTQQMFQKSGNRPVVQGYKGLYNSFNKAGENALSSVEENLPQGQDLENFQRLKRGYGTNSEALKMISDRNAREAANRMFSPSDYGAGMAGGIMSASEGDNGYLSMLKSLGAAGLNKGLRGYGNQMQASSWQALADAMKRGLDPFEKAAVGTGAINSMTPRGR